MSEQVCESLLTNGCELLCNCHNLSYRLKEELIHELVKSSRSMQQLNHSYLSKIHQLEREASLVKRELEKTQGALQKQRSNKSRTSHEDKQLTKLVE